MSVFFCDCCNNPRHTDDEEYHYGTDAKGAVILEWCGNCNIHVMDGDSGWLDSYAFAAIDGKNLATHFLCCSEVIPESERGSHRELWHRDEVKERKTWPVPETTHTAQEVARRYAANCQAHNRPDFVPAQCWECGYPILMMRAAEVMSGKCWGLTRCEGCGKSYCE